MALVDGRIWLRVVSLSLVYTPQTVRELVEVLYVRGVCALELTHPLTPTGQTQTNNFALFCGRNVQFAK